MDKIFGAKPNLNPVPPAVQGQQTAPGNIPAVPAVVANQNNPASPVVPEVPKTPVSPLDEFSPLWQTDLNAKPVVEAPMFNVDPAKMAAAAKGNDFTKAVTPEMLAAIAAGGEGAVKATLEAMNAVAQKGFADSAIATTKIVEQALAKQQDKFEKSLPNLIKNQNLSENLRNSNPIFNHPAAAPILEMFKNQVTQKYPQATAAEQQEMAVKYLTSFAEAANPPKQSAAQKQSAANEMDWSTFLPE